MHAKLPPCQAQDQDGLSALRRKSYHDVVVAQLGGWDEEAQVLGETLRAQALYRRLRFRLLEVTETHQVLVLEVAAR